MIQLAFLLLGAEAIKRRWAVLGVIGLAWGLLGLAIVTEAVEHIQGYTMHILGLLLVIEGCVTVLAGIAGYRPRLWHVKAMALVLPGLAVIETPLRNLMVISMLFGFALMADSVVRGCAVLLVRFPGWRLALVGTAIEFVLAMFALTPWPVTYEATIPFCISVALILSGWTVVRSALRLRRLDPGAPVTSLPIFEHERGWHASVSLPATQPSSDGSQRMIVHVWTALATVTDPVRRPLLDRYVAAVDRQGEISTGHAALEMPPDLYISHYRAEEINRAVFRQALNAGPQNNVAGRFLTSYPEEVASWCEATAHVEFQRFSPERLRAFWETYRRDSTYNLTNRNCSVVVALALDAALEGVLAQQAFWPPLIRLAINPELYLATLLRRRARTMTWTPGLVLDYARALQRVVEPPPLPWPVMIWQAAAHWRQARDNQLRPAEPALRPAGTEPLS